MPGIIGITGTPGTGKKTVSPRVADLLGTRAISINSLAPEGETEVDPAQLRRALGPRRRGVLLYGHLLPYVLRKREARFVAVLRCEPSVLRRRLMKRGYTRAHVTENVEAELIGVLLDECVRTYGARLVHEYDTTSTPPDEVARAIARDVKAPRHGRAAGAPWIDWTLDYDSSSKLTSLLSGKEEPPAST